MSAAYVRHVLGTCAACRAWLERVWPTYLACRQAIGKKITTEVAAASDYDHYGGLWYSHTCAHACDLL